MRLNGIKRHTRRVMPILVAALTVRSEAVLHRACAGLMTATAAIGVLCTAVIAVSA